MKRIVMLTGVVLFVASSAMATNHEIKPVMPNLSGIGIGIGIMKELYKNTGNHTSVPTITGTCIHLTMLARLRSGCE